MVEFHEFSFNGEMIKIYPGLVELLRIYRTVNEDDCAPKKITIGDINQFIEGEKSLEQFVAELRSPSFNQEIAAVNKKDHDMCSSTSNFQLQQEKQKKDAANARRKKQNLSLTTRCKLCKGTRLRVINPGRTDGKRILECANRYCLASIKFTELPEGTIIEDDKNSSKNYGWYLRDPVEIFYPSDKTIATTYANDKPKDYVPEILYDSHRNIVVRCPGQRKLVKLA